MKISLSDAVFIDRTLATLNYCSILPFGFLGFFSYYRSKTDLSGGAICQRLSWIHVAIPDWG